MIYWLIGSILVGGIFATASAAATVMFRLTAKDGVLQDYYQHPDAFPVCKSGVDCILFSTGADRLIRPDGQRLFDTQSAAIEIDRGAAKDNSYTGKETVDAMAAYEAQGFTVKYVIVYREDWLFLHGSGGPWKEDNRILSMRELQNIRDALKASHLKSKISVKIIQLFGARVHGHRGDSWFQIVKDPALLAHLTDFDGIGVECHVGDQNVKKSDGPGTLASMASITKWAQDHQKDAFIFMGGAPSTYQTPAITEATYQYLWSEMARLGVDKKDANLLYYRQGARAGTHLPEDGNSLSSQVKWLIGKVKL